MTNQKKTKKQKKWIKFRHKVIRNLAYLVIKPFCVLKYGIKIEKFKEQKKNTPYLILLNHQTVFDQFFVGIAFKGPVYYMATEDIFSNGWVSSLIRYAVAPIPIKKQTTDVHAVINSMRVVKEGGTIAIAPEGNRTYSGKTEYMNPSISFLIKKLNLPVAFYRIEGGYGVQPRWCDKIRKGKMRGYVSRVVEPEEYASMTNDEIYEMVQKELYVNEACVDGVYYSKKNAEYLERLIYVCPNCGLSNFYSEGDTLECKKCGLKARYLPTKEFETVNGDVPFRFVNDWYEYQKDFVNQLDTAEYIDKPIFRDHASFSEVIVYKNKNLLRKDAEITLYGDRIVVDEGRKDEFVIPFENTMALSVLGRNKLNIYYGKQLFQLKGSKHFNAIKYVNIYYRNKNIVKGEQDVKFLGL